MHALQILPQLYDLELSRRQCIIKSSLLFRTLRMRTEMDLETSVFSYFNHLTRLVAREDFIIHPQFLLEIA
jgi:hypothetical protein